VYAKLGLRDAPTVLDMRTASDLAAQPRMIPGALRCDPDTPAQWMQTLPRDRSLVLYGARDASRAETGALAAWGLPLATLEGGFDAWTRQGFATIAVRTELNVPGGSRWITRERPKIDRLACPWLIRRFIDPLALFFYVPAHQVRSEAGNLRAEPYDIADVTFTHRGPRCSFDAFLHEFGLHDPVLDFLAGIVRAADTARLEQSREAPGLLAISLGLSAMVSDDILLLEHAMTLYDGLYAWCKTARDETHAWPQRTVAQ